MKEEAEGDVCPTATDGATQGEASSDLRKGRQEEGLLRNGDAGVALPLSTIYRDRVHQCRYRTAG